MLFHCNWFQIIAIGAIATIVLALFSLFTNHWIVLGGLTKGLWKTCIKKICISSRGRSPVFQILS